MTPPLFIIDAHSQIFRAYYAIRGLRAPDGRPTNAVFGFAQMTNRLIRERGVEHLIAVFDPPGPTTRDEYFADYKKGREATPDDLVEQIPLVERYLDLIGAARVSVENWEADDVIGALVHQARQQGRQVFIVSADKDLFQLVGPDVKALRLEQGNIVEYGPELVAEKMGAPPKKIADLLALTGDSVDNIPGVPGIGPKTAAKILEQYESVEELLDHPERLENARWRALIEEHRDKIRLSKRLTTIVPDAPVPIRLSEIQFPPHDTKALVTFYKDLNFQSLLAELTADDAADKTTASDQPDARSALDYRMAQTVEELREIAEALKRAGAFAFDTETTSADPWTCDLVGVSVAWLPNAAWYIPVALERDLFQKTQGMAIGDVKRFLGPVFADSGISKIGHNIKFDIKVLERAGMPVEGVVFDSMVAAYLLNADRQSLSLKNLAYDELGISMTPISELIGTGKKQISMLEVPVEKVRDYACADADCTLQLSRRLKERLEESGLTRLYEDVEHPLIGILMRMENTGVRIDVNHFAALQKTADEKLARLAERIFELSGGPINLNSPKQLADLLFNRLKLPVLKKGKTGPSTDVSVLEELKSRHPLAELLLQYRSIEKLKNTYIEVMPRLVNPQTGRIHTSYNQTVTATGRLSSSNPNLQNIPVGSVDGINIRQGFVPLGDGDVLVSADYSQIELRVLAHLSGDPALVEAFQTNRDVHALTASKVFKVPLEQVTPAMRAQAKMVNFGVIYGMSARGLQQRLGISYDEAKTFIREYFEAYRGVQIWIKKTVDAARENGYVSTLLNRRRYLSDISSKNRTTRSNAERIAINTPIQGTAADMIKLAMVQIDQRLRRTTSRASMIMQVHDELIFNMPADEVEAAVPVIKAAMEEALALSVPVVVDVHVGRNWAECK